MLGHPKIAQIQKYAKVTSLKIERETRGLFERLKDENIFFIPIYI
jgi:hypothetical protein